MSFWRKTCFARTPNWNSVSRAVSARNTRFVFELVITVFLVYLCSRALLHSCWYSGFPLGTVPRLSIDEEHDLPAYVPGSTFFQRLACFLEWEGALELHGDLTSVD